MSAVGLASHSKKNPVIALITQNVLIESILDGDSPRRHLSWHIANNAIGACVITGPFDGEPPANRRLWILDFRLWTFENVAGS